LIDSNQLDHQLVSFFRSPFFYWGELDEEELLLDEEEDLLFFDLLLCFFIFLHSKTSTFSF
jgi:hypothetical protein